MKLKKVVRDGKEIKAVDLGDGLLRPLSRFESGPSVLQPGFERELELVIGKMPQPTPKQVAIRFRESDYQRATQMVGGSSRHQRISR